MPATPVKLPQDPVDEALDQSFPASDPPSTSVPVVATSVAEPQTVATAVQLHRIIPGASKHAPLSPKAPWPERRWADPETGLIRLSFSLPMAILEFLSEIEGPTPESLLVLSLRLAPDSIDMLGDYPPGWDALPYEPTIRRVGDGWAARQSSLALQVPSAICPGEHALLLNPRHPDATGLSTYEVRAFRLDPRLRI